MGASFLNFPMRVAVRNQHRKQAVYRIRIAMRAGDRTSRITLSGPAFATTDNLPAFQSVAAAFGDWIAAVPSLRQRNWRTAIERFRNLAALAVRRLLSRGKGARLIVNFCRRLKVPGNLSSFLGALVQPAKQSSRRVFHRFQFPPVLRSLVAHESNHRRRNIGNGQTCIGEFRNVVR